MISDPPVMPPPATIAPPFTIETATRKVRMAEDIWNSREPDRLASNCTEDSTWRYRGEFLVGRDAIRDFYGSQESHAPRTPGRPDFSRAKS